MIIALQLSHLGALPLLVLMFRQKLREKERVRQSVCVCLDVPLEAILTVFKSAEKSCTSGCLLMIVLTRKWSKVDFPSFVL